MNGPTKKERKGVRLKQKAKKVQKSDGKVKNDPNS
jgi:hypothetical protein